MGHSEYQNYLKGYTPLDTAQNNTQILHLNVTLIRQNQKSTWQILFHLSLASGGKKVMGSFY